VVVSPFKGGGEIEYRIGVNASLPHSGRVGRDSGRGGRSWLSWCAIKDGLQFGRFAWEAQYAILVIYWRGGLGGYRQPSSASKRRWSRGAHLNSAVPSEFEKPAGRFRMIECGNPPRVRPGDWWHVWSACHTTGLAKHGRCRQSPHPEKCRPQVSSVTM